MWQRHFAGKLARTAVSGSVVTVGSATVSCLLAVYVERSAHRTLYRFFPHWYKDVDHVPLGLEQWQLDAVRSVEAEDTMTVDDDERDHSDIDEKPSLMHASVASSNETIFTTEPLVSAQLLTIPLTKTSAERIMPTRRPTVTPTRVFSCAMTA